MKIFADGASTQTILEMNKNPLIQGFTCNPTLMRQTGIRDYKGFALDVLSVIKDKPFSFEVIADTLNGMFQQALEISLWGSNVFVKIPITDTKGNMNFDLINKLSYVTIRVNVTAITTIKQVMDILPALKYTNGAYISIFAGRIADCGVDPLPIMKQALKLIKGTNIELIWASPREVYNIYQAEKIGCHIITCTADLIKKYEALKGKDLTEYSLDTIKMFYRDAKESGLTL